MNVVLVLRLYSEVTMTQGDVMTSRESLYLDGTWATDDDDDGLAPEASHPHERGRELKTKIYLKASEVGLSGFSRFVDVLFSVTWNCGPLSHRLRGWGLSEMT